MKEYQRKQLLERVNREGATIGAQIPDEIEIQGETLDLQTFVFEIKRRETIPPGERDRVEQAKRNLRRERIERVEQIEENRVSYEEGGDIVESVIGIDRALNALNQLRPVDLDAESQRQEAADKKRWMGFLRKALDRDSTGNRSR